VARRAFPVVRRRAPRPVGDGPTPRRIAVVDALRGVCFVAMTVDHLPGSPISRFTNPYLGLPGFFTAALGFVFLSGFVSGLVYDRELAVSGRSGMLRRVLRRIRALYVTQMLLFAALLVAVALHVRGFSDWHLDLFDTDPWRGLVLSGALLYEPDYLGILPMYVLFLLLTPAVLLLFGRKRWKEVIGASALLWIATGLLIHLPANPDGVYFGALNPLSYQFLFVVGLAFGARHLGIGRVPALVSRWVVGACAAVAIVGAGLRFDYGLGGPLNPLLDRLAPWYSDVQLGPLRLLNFAAFAVCVYWLSRRLRGTSVAFRWLSFVGRHSLPVFAWSILTAYATAAFEPHPAVWLALVLMFVTTASLTVPAQLHALLVRPRAIALPPLDANGHVPAWALAPPSHTKG
jgi:hypothetical protein